jgi:pheromone shutdown protein TraB
VDSQEELNRYENYLNKDQSHWLEYYWGSRKFIFLARWALYWTTFKMHFRFGFDFKFWLPGIEVKYALEAAEKVGANVKYLGPEMNALTADRLYHETRMNVPHYIFKRIQYHQSQYTEENGSNRQKIALAGPRAFTEKCLDQHLINWYIQSSNIFFPKVKEIFVDKRDEDLFT